MYPSLYDLERPRSASRAGAGFVSVGYGLWLPLMTQTDAERERLLSQRALRPLHQFRKFGDRGASLGMRFDQFNVFIRVFFAFGLSRFSH